ncbi:ABC transporter permease subunit [Tuwongella immobilis]|uniref:ABC-2 type transporter domain-containing protein n=1 Tax=Tuwongella immobilis TaxID=692036 RepID=A0A6C2YLL8_9BACT|nr:ABC transporter permease subunit [Tuwongella immobilis]VIP02211.1 ABC-type Na+ efflux pump, permease component OS=Singulisphaera acidiphila (strain ATCC BAA-1392 / DSM 18658 / VKM B-2454 / MOB10) GN=Sinac_6077 PE=4 SV=1: ABC2_membrane_2 [Tuwongella immobilis]VTS00720.1 ABC-type Na+ efflux pump, permease component OS=Singulisphaera acidiphila (strain ATCC BAA-1392 / DSM 18658 / VKM B-2454 / MOB10) GN=Sinac_6077 PE=4 SV=1: ABC2_membrane_2 [Tuwongella immobilis]
MRASIVRLIAGREMRDLLRDRRTLFLVFGMPILLYPIFFGISIFLARSLGEQVTIIGVVGSEFLPPEWDRREPEPVSVLVGGLGQAERQRQSPDYPTIAFLLESRDQDNMLDLEATRTFRLAKLTSDDVAPLDAREVDVIVVIPETLQADLLAFRKPTIRVLGRPGDDVSKIGIRRVVGSLNDWALAIREIRFQRKGLPADFDDVLVIDDPIENRPALERTVEELRDSLVKFLPFLIIMWTMAGALHPAIDLTAGEKERGTMETLLISPAERLEIVAGKFLATCLFSYVSAVVNVVALAAGMMVLSLFLPNTLLSVPGLMWSLLFAVPLAMLFAAVSISLGTYARSTKEGQYYLIPLFMVTMPLAFYAMTPGMMLTWSNSLIPITGISLLLQSLMSPVPGPMPWGFFVPVTLSLAVSIALSLFWAVRQFRQESVLFREAEQFNLFAWIRQKLQDR